MGVSTADIPEAKPGELVSPKLKINFAIPLIGFGLLFFIIAATAILAFRQASDQAAVRHSAEVQSRLSRILSLLQAAETGQRGYLITGDESYLEPFNNAAPQIQAEARSLQAAMAGNETHGQAAAALLAVTREKLAELQRTVELRRRGRTEEAIAMVRGGAGKESMDRARALIGQMAAQEGRILVERQAAALNTDRALQFGIVAAIVVLIGLAGVAFREMHLQFKAVNETRRFMERANRQLVAEATQREKLGQQLREAQKMEAIGQLSGGIAHDFNNMLTVVMGSLNLIKRRIERGDSNVVELIDGGLDGAQRAATLTERLLAVARQQPLAPESIDVNKFVAKMSDLLRHTLGEDIRFETVLAGGIWRTHIDASQLENAILNLCVNARDSMPNGGKLTIETANASLDDAYAAEHGVTPGQYVLIAVTDTGTGMSAETAEKAFDPFFTTKTGKGTGLGLSQVYGFVRQSGGHAKIYSEPGHGTTIKLYLPRYMQEAEEGSLAASKIDAAGMRGRPHEPVLVVEDDEQVRTLTVSAVEELGYRVHQAGNAAAALRILDAHPEIVLLFTDIVMPDMNGRALAEEAQRRRPGLKVLFTTGFTRHAVIHNGIVDPGISLLAKPFSLEALAAKLRSVLGTAD